MQSLINNCSKYWTNRNGVWGYLVMGMGAYSSKSIFFPAAGDAYTDKLINLGSRGFGWTSTPNSTDSSYAYGVKFDSGKIVSSDSARYLGLFVRPVSDQIEKPVVYSAITYENLCGTKHANPSMYQEGLEVVFTSPTERSGYTFAGWSPAMLSSGTTGAKTVRANWTANAYTIVFQSNGGSGVMPDLGMIYDVETELPACTYTRSGYLFAGWSTSAIGDIAYRQGETVSNLTTVVDGAINLYACWTAVEPVVVYSAITYANLHGATHTNPATYREGQELIFGIPAQRMGYEFGLFCKIGHGHRDETRRICRLSAA